MPSRQPCTEGPRLTLKPATAPVTNKTIIAQAMVTLTIFDVSGLLSGSSSEMELVATWDAVAVLVSVGSIKTGVLGVVLDISDRGDRGPKKGFSL